MAKKAGSTPRRADSLSRDQIIEASIDLLDRNGESGLTFRALSERLATGPGAIYWHIDNKSDLLTAACDTIVARTIKTPRTGTAPKKSIRTVALGLFDAIDTHPWVGSALTQAPGQLPMVRIFESIGQQVCLLGVPKNKQWAVVSALLNYILGVSGQNAANTQTGRERGLDRSSFLKTMSIAWSRLDPVQFPFTRSVAGQLPVHDDRVDFIAGIDFILSGIKTSGD